MRGGGPALRLIAAGGGRRCYAHPLDPTLCIKVPFTSAGWREARREAAYLRRVERLHGPLDARHLARLHGTVRTTLGPGWVFDRVRDERSGEASPTLGAALDEAAYAREPERWERALADLAHWLRCTPLVVRDLIPDNLCVRRTAGEGLELVLIDGIGPVGTLPRWLPLRAYARSRNARHTARYGLTSMRELLARTRDERARREAAREERALAVPSTSLADGSGGAEIPVRLLDP